MVERIGKKRSERTVMLAVGSREGRGIREDEDAGRICPKRGSHRIFGTF